MLSRRFLSGAFAAALVVVLGACGTQSEPPQQPPTAVGMPSDAGGEITPGGGGETASPSGADEPESQPTADAPHVPAPNPDEYPNRDQRTPEGAEQTVRYYFALVFWGYETGDLGPSEAMYSDACKGCAYFKEEVEEVRETGDYWEGVSIEDFAVEAFDSPVSECDVGYIFRLAVTSGGYEGMSDEGTYYTTGAAVNWSGESWTIVDILFEKSSGQ